MITGNQDLFPKPKYYSNYQISLTWMIYSHIERERLYMRRICWRRISSSSRVPFIVTCLQYYRLILVFELLTQSMMAHMGLSHRVLYIEAGPTMVTWLMYRYIRVAPSRPTPWPNPYNAIIHFSNINHHVSNKYCIYRNYPITDHRCFK